MRGTTMLGSRVTIKGGGGKRKIPSVNIKGKGDSAAGIGSTQKSILKGGSRATVGPQ